MQIEHFIKKDHVIYVKSSEKQLVIKELLTALEELKEIEDAGRVYAQIMHRESLDNTGIGKGLAIPHIRTDSVNELKSIFAISREGIDYHSHDGLPVRYLLLNIVPTEQSTKYLYLVGMMAWIFSDDERRTAMDAAKTRPSAYALLKKYSDLYFAGLTDKNRPGADPNDNLMNVPSVNLDLLIRLDRLNQLCDEGDNSEAIQDKINDLRKIIDRKSLAYYEKMRKRSLNPFAILDRNACTGCHMDLAPYYLAQVRESKNIAVCNHCGRFLIVI
jgi:mannitol/fructose-specific phosphotransferase system IIA component (Ntr-type)